jgi:hypothetical protein
LNLNIRKRILEETTPMPDVASKSFVNHQNVDSVDRRDLN